MQVASGKQLMHLHDTALPIWSPNEKAFAATSVVDNASCVYDLPGQSVLFSSPADYRLDVREWAPNSQEVISLTWSRSLQQSLDCSQIWVIDTRADAILCTLPVFPHPWIPAFCVSPDSCKVAVCNWDEAKIYCMLRCTTVDCHA